MKKENLKGRKFNKLLVIEETKSRVTPKGVKVTQWICLCDCGNRTVVTSNNLKRGHIKSCGCLKGGNIKHRCSDKRIYHIWVNMIQRCTNPHNNDFKNYGGRGIKICNSWKEDFVNFYNWAMKNGYTEKLTIERIDVNKGYEPNNCTWITKAEQAHNKRNNYNITINREKHCITEWANIFNIPLTTLRRKSQSDFMKLYNEYYSGRKLEER